MQICVWLLSPLSLFLSHSSSSLTLCGLSSCASMVLGLSRASADSFEEDSPVQIEQHPGGRLHHHYRLSLCFHQHCKFSVWNTHWHQSKQNKDVLNYGLRNKQKILKLCSSQQSYILLHHKLYYYSNCCNGCNVNKLTDKQTLKRW